MLLRCYPKITDFIFHFFNQASWADYRFLPVYSYGFFVALGFLAASLLAVSEMRRREKLGLLPYTETEVTIAGKMSSAEIAITFLISFFVFFKLGGLVAYQQELSSGKLILGDFFLNVPMGSWVAGWLGGGAFTGYQYILRKKEQAGKKTIKIYPSDGIGDLVLIAAVLGVLGSVLFNFLETDGSIAQIFSDPIGFLTSGLSIYGGLICAGLGFAAYAWKKKLHFGHFFDSIAPGFILANGIGRIGCQVSGDGDWGIPNLHPNPGWLPEFLWTDNYAYHIVGCDPAVDVIIPNCAEANCCQLAQAVYPTPVYEFLMCAAIFLILWALRKKLTNMPGVLFTVFMILIGIQRFTIEQFRDLEGRSLHNYFGIELRQSEEISIVLFTLGVTGTLYLWNRYKAKTIT